MEIDETTLKTLQNLAKEDGKTPKNIIKELVEQEDFERHIVWNTKKAEFVRTKCPRPHCKETITIPRSEIKN